MIRNFETESGDNYGDLSVLNKRLTDGFMSKADPTFFEQDAHPRTSVESIVSACSATVTTRLQVAMEAKGWRRLPNFQQIFACVRDQILEKLGRTLFPRFVTQAHIDFAALNNGVDLELAAIVHNAKTDVPKQTEELASA